MIDQSDPGAPPKARVRKKAAMPATEPTPPAHPIRTGIERPRGNATLWSMFAVACAVILVLLGVMANRPKPIPADATQVAASPDSSQQVVAYGADAGPGTAGPLPENAGGGTYAPGAASPGVPGATGTTAPGSVGNAGAVAMTGTTGGVNAGAPGGVAAGAGARSATPSGGAFGPGATGAGAAGATGAAAGSATGGGPH